MGKTRLEFETFHGTNIEIADIVYPIEEGWRHCWVFDNSSCHNAMAEDALHVNKMNVG